jgi:hypothetical protein
MTEAERHERRLDIMEKRDASIAGWRRRGVSYIKYTTTRFPHSSTRQRARYARQIAAGHLNIGRVVALEPVEPVKAKKPRVRKTIGAVVE